VPGSSPIARLRAYSRLRPWCAPRHDSGSTQRRRNRVAAFHTALGAALATLVPVLACGCGSSSNGVASKSPAEILASAISAAQQASSVHIQASSANGPLTLTLDMSYAKNGAHGTVSLPNLDYQLIRIGNTLYVSGNSHFYRELAQTLSGHTATAVAELPPGTWLRAAASSGPASGLADITEMNSELALILGRGTSVAKGAQTSVDGQQAIELKETAKLYDGSLFIATTGKPYPVLQRETGRETGQTRFGDWNKPVTLTPPANATAISQLEHPV
jgi:hypothetical protein